MPDNPLQLKNACIKVSTPEERRIALEFYREATKNPISPDSNPEGIYVGVTRIGYNNKIDETVCASNYVASGETIVAFNEVPTRLVHNRRRKYCLKVATALATNTPMPKEEVTPAPAGAADA